MASRRRSTAFGIAPERMALCRDAWPWIFVPSVDTLPHCPPPLSAARRTPGTTTSFNASRGRWRKSLLVRQSGRSWPTRAPKARGRSAGSPIPPRSRQRATGRPSWLDRRAGRPGFRAHTGHRSGCTPTGHGIKEAADPVALGQRGRRALCLLPLALRLPGTRRFPPAFTHHRAPNVWGIAVSYAEKSLIV